jgi:hypothetical protein
VAEKAAVPFWKHITIKTEDFTVGWRKLSSQLRKERKDE